MNRATHTYPDAQSAQLHGWRRAWVQTPAREALFLSVEPDEQTTIDGLIAAVPDADWAALDLREAAYARIHSGTAVSHGLAPAPEVSHYTVLNTQKRANTDSFIILSYLDIVVQGFLQEFGEDGVARFFATTAAWDVPILNDRAAPRYPRYHKLSATEEALVDHHLDALSARMK